MTRTPWGRADQLRSRKLKPGPSHDREAVVRNQRERLYGAMVAALDEKGYLETTVADVVRLSGVSRADYYKHFANKEECFIATFDAIVDGAMASITHAAAKADDTLSGQAAVLDALFDLIVQQPAAARVVLIEIYPAGATAMARGDEATKRLQRLLKQTLDRSPDTAGMPLVLMRALLGGIHKVIYTRLRTGKQDELPGLVEQVHRWILSYPPPPGPLDRRLSQPPQPTATPPSDGSEEQRLMAATATLVRDKTYDGMTITDIARVAATSFTTFYAHFKSKEDAFLATYELATNYVFAAVFAAYQGAGGWERGVADGLREFHDILSRETAWAHVGLVDVMAAGPRALDHMDNGIELFSQAFLAPGYERAPQLPPIAGEAIGGGIYSLWHEHIRRRGAGRLGELVPTVTYFVLAPFVGADEAMAQAKPRRRAAY